MYYVATSVQPDGSDHLVRDIKRNEWKNLE